MTVGTGLFLSTLLVLTVAILWQITAHKKWRVAGKVSAIGSALLILLGVVVYSWIYFSNLPSPPTVTTELVGIKLGMTPVEVKLKLGQPVSISDPEMEGERIRIDIYYSTAAIVFYGSDKYTTKAEIICTSDRSNDLLGISGYDGESKIIERLGDPDATSIRKDGLAKMISYSKWNATFQIEKGEIVQECIHDFPVMSFVEEYPTREEQEASDTRAEAERKRIEAIPETATSEAAPTQDPAERLDPCAPDISKQERLRRLGAYGSIRQDSSESYTAGSHRVGFFMGKLNYCH